MIGAAEQSASPSFFLAVVLAWAGVFLGLEALRRAHPNIWPCEAAPRSTRPGLDLALALLAAFAVIGLGALWQSELRDRLGLGAGNDLAFAVAQLAIWSPLGIVLLARRQPLSSAWTGTRHLGLRLGAGLVLGVAAVVLYLLARWYLDRLPEIARKATEVRSWAHAVPVYLEGVGVAFLFVRLDWALGRFPALLVPALLFALGHVFRSQQEGEALARIAVFFAFNTAFVALLLALLVRYRDVVSLGVAHWCMDLAIDAF